MEYKYDPIMCMNIPVEKKVTKDKVITKDKAADDFKKAIQLVDQIRQITRKYARKIDASALFAYCDKVEDKFQYYIDNASKGWYD